jgi:SulP family sulfate permease
LRSYRREWIGGDLRGGLSACLVMIPSVIAYAELADLKPEYGLYAALVAMLGYALLASSRHVIAGPDAAITLLLASTVGPLAGRRSGAHCRALGGRGAPRWSADAARGAPASGNGRRLPVDARADRLHDRRRADPPPRHSWGKLFGIELEHRSFFLVLRELFTRLHETHLVTLGLGLGLLGLLVALRHWFPRLPGALVVVVVAMVASWAFGLERTA